MFRLQCITYCFLIYYAVGDTASVSFIKSCKPHDVACMKASAIDAYPHFTEGVPALGLPPADPIILNDVRADDKNLKLGFRDLKVTGIKQCKTLDFVRDLDKSTMTLIVECPLTATGKYDLDGKLLLLSVTGNGDFTIKTDKTKLEVTTKIKVVEIDGAKHWKITGFDYKYDIIEKATIHLENLFDGDETRAKPVKEIINNSSTELIADIGGPIIKELVNKQVDIVQKFFNKVPISDLEQS